MLKNNLILLSPLEQFEINIVKRVNFFDLIDIRFTYSSLCLIARTIAVRFMLYKAVQNAKIIPNYWQSSVEMFILGIRETVIQQAGKARKKFLPLFIRIFLFIMTLNVTGLIPMGFTVTRHILVTLALSFRLSIGLLILAFDYNGISFLKIFAPSDAPKPLLPLIIVIEIIRYLIRPFSLAIRLFANMMAGHTLLFILSGFVLAFLYSPFFILAIIPLILVYAVVGLEVGISLLQAYVFTVLFTIYSNDSLNFSAH